MFWSRSLVQFLLNLGQIHKIFGELLLVVLFGHGCFAVLQCVDLLLQILFLREQLAFRRVRGGFLCGTQPDDGESREQQPLATFGRRRADRVAFASVLKNGMFGGQALLWIRKRQPPCLWRIGMFRAR